MNGLTAFVAQGSQSLQGGSARAAAPVRAGADPTEPLWESQHRSIHTWAPPTTRKIKFQRSHSGQRHSQVSFPRTVSSCSAPPHCSPFPPSPCSAPCSLLAAPSPPCQQFLLTGALCFPRADPSPQSPFSFSPAPPLLL